MRNRTEVIIGRYFERNGSFKSTKNDVIPFQFNSFCRCRFAHAFVRMVIWCIRLVYSKRSYQPVAIGSMHSKHIIWNTPVQTTLCTKFTDPLIMIVCGVSLSLSFSLTFSLSLTLLHTIWYLRFHEHCVSVWKYRSVSFRYVQCAAFALYYTLTSVYNSPPAVNSNSRAAHKHIICVNAIWYLVLLGVFDSNVCLETRILDANIQCTSTHTRAHKSRNETDYTMVTGGSAFNSSLW